MNSYLEIHLFWSVTMHSAYIVITTGFLFVFMQCGALLPALINHCSVDAEREVYSKMIADRIRSIGDRYARKYGEDQLERKLMSLVLHRTPANMNLTSALSVLQGRLSWQKVSEIFAVPCRASRITCSTVATVASQLVHIHGLLWKYIHATFK